MVQVPPPKTFLDYRFKRYEKIPAGVSMGVKSELYYWTLGVTICNAKGIRFGLTNAHNLNRGGKLIITQPSSSRQDRKYNPRDVGFRVDSMFTTDSCREDLKYQDAAIFQFLPDVVSIAEVLARKGERYQVDGLVTWNEIKRWSTDGTKYLYLSSRLSGWCRVKFLSAGWFYDNEESFHDVNIEAWKCTKDDADDEDVENPIFRYKGMLLCTNFSCFCCLFVCLSVWPV